MNSTICWMPVRDIADMNCGTFALAPGTHKRGILHSKDLPNYRIPEGSVHEHEWRSAAYRVGDVVIFRDDTVHAALPNLSNAFRLSIDLRVGSSLAPQPVGGTVESVDGRSVTYRSVSDLLKAKRDIEAGLIASGTTERPVSQSYVQRVRT